MTDIDRTLSSVIRQVSAGHPVVCVNGPRQSGKSTLVRMVFPDRPHVTCKDASTFAQAQDPVAFLGQFPNGAVIDEIQRVPHVLEHLQTIVDKQRVMGRWIITGSENLSLVRTMSESLAGRVAILNLLPFSHSELTAAPRQPQTLAHAVLLGGYPPIFDSLRQVEPWRWLTNYIDTYVQRDVLSLLRIQDRSAFSRFLQLCARHVGCQTNAQQWGAEIGKDSKTIAGWLSVLEATFVLRLMPTSSHSFGKRMSKHPKLYFYDTGVACSLLGLTEVNQVAGHPQWGHLVENWCVMEVLKSRWHRGLPESLSHWRSNDGHEVDLTLETNAKIFPIEIKAAQTANPNLIDGITRWREIAHKKNKTALLGKGMVIYGGDQPLTINDHRLVPWHSIDAAMTELGI